MHPLELGTCAYYLQAILIFRQTPQSMNKLQFERIWLIVLFWFNSMMKFRRLQEPIPQQIKQGWKRKFVLLHLLLLWQASIPNPQILLLILSAKPLLSAVGFRKLMLLKLLNTHVLLQLGHLGLRPSDKTIQTVWVNSGAKLAEIHGNQVIISQHEIKQRKTRIKRVNTKEAATMG